MNATQTNEKKLTIAEANKIADGKVIVTVDAIDSDLWAVGDNDALQCQEPMTETEWRTFLADW